MVYSYFITYWRLLFCVFTFRASDVIDCCQMVSPAANRFSLRMSRNKLRRVFLSLIMVGGIFGLYKTLPWTTDVVHKSVKTVRATLQVRTSNRTTVVTRRQNVNRVNASMLAWIERIEKSDTSSQWVMSHPGPRRWNCSGSPRIYKGVENMLCTHEYKHT